MKILKSLLFRSSPERTPTWAGSRLGAHPPRLSLLRSGAVLCALAALATGAALAQAHAGTSAGGATTGIGALMDAAKAKASDSTFLSPDAAFQVAAVADGPDRVRIDYSRRPPVAVEVAAPA